MNAELEVLKEKAHDAGILAIAECAVAWIKQRQPEPVLPETCTEAHAIWAQALNDVKNATK